jgi:resuscitation-promoting factor RpfB
MGVFFKIALVAWMFLGLLGVASPHVFAESEPKSGERVVTINDNGDEMTFFTDAPTVDEALQRVHNYVYAEDHIEPSLDSELTSANQTITIKRARPVIIDDVNRQIYLNTPETDENKIIEEAGVVLNPEDEVRVERIDDMVSHNASGEKLVIERDKPVTAEMAAVAKRGKKEIQTKQEAVAFTTREVQDPNHETGYRQLKTSGKPGTRIVTYEVEVLRGQELSRTEVSNIVTEQPTEEVVVVGSKPSPTGNRAIGKKMMLEKGFAENQWTCLDNLWTRESNWNQLAHNASSGAHGIPQALPATKMASHGADYMTNPATQIAWGLDYIKNRYGTPCSAWSFWQSKSPHWY